MQGGRDLGEASRLQQEPQRLQEEQNWLVVSALGPCMPQLSQR